MLAARRNHQQRIHNVSTLNGFGTLYYGWRHAQDGTATATKWFAISWVPVIPLYREHLRVLTDFKKDHKNVKAELGGLVVGTVDKYQILKRLPLSAQEVAVTLAKTYIGLPALLLGPAILLVLAMKALQATGGDVKPGSTAFVIYGAGIFLAFANFLWQAVRAIRKARGWQPNI